MTFDAVLEYMARRVRRWPFVLSLVLVALGALAAAWLVRSQAPPRDALRPALVYERVIVEPQPVITGTMNGDCHLSKIETGGHTWREHYDRYRAAPAEGRLVVAEVGARWATAKFEGVDGSESGTFVIAWDGAYYPSSDPCGH